MNSELIINRVNDTVRNFGEYELYDKGVFEVAEIDDLIDKLILLSPNEASKILKDLEKYKYGTEVISSILIRIQDISSNEWFDNLFLLEPSLYKYY